MSRSFGPQVAATIRESATSLGSTTDTLTQELL
jgi:hypothetical protein